MVVKPSLEQRSLTEIGLFIPPTMDEVKILWPRGVPLTREIYNRVVRMMEDKRVSVWEAYELIHEEDSGSDYAHSR